MALKTFTWCVDAGATRTTEPRTNTVQFGDGYDQVSSFGINNVRESWQVAKTGRKTEIDAIHAFLVEHKNVTPFHATIAGEVGAYRSTGSPSTTHLGGNVWSISFNLKQVFIP